MDRRNFIKVSALTAAGIVVSPTDKLFLSSKLLGQEKPNLLFIITDQQRYDTLSIAGNHILKTPNLGRLAREGVWFKNAYTQCAVCAPARCSILTGHTVEHHEIQTNELSSSRKESGRMSMPTFDEILSRNGYHCEYFGKWHAPEFHSKVYKNPKVIAKNGKSVFSSGGAFTYLYHDYLNLVFPKGNPAPGELYDNFSQRYYIPNPLDKGYGKSPGELRKLKLKEIQPDHHGILLVPAKYSLTSFLAGKTIDSIERNKDRTFSITCSLHFPHAPMLPVKPYADMYPAKEMPVPASISDPMCSSPYTYTNGRLANPEYADPAKIKYMISNYYSLIKEIDDWIGKILNKLNELGLDKNTFVIFTSDHGEMLGSHGMREKNVFYQESSRVPLIMRFPGKIKANTTIDGYVSTMALFSTILDYLHINKFPNDGKSLRGLIEGTDSSLGNNVVTEWLYRGDVEPNYMIVEDNWKLFIPYSEESAVINVLYNLKKDPYEMNNLVGCNPERENYKEKANALRNDMLMWLKQHQSKHYEGVKARQL